MAPKQPLTWEKVSKVAKVAIFQILPSYLAASARGGGAALTCYCE